YLDQYSNQLDTRAVRIGRGAIESSYDVLDAQLDPGPWLVAADETTWQAAGERLTDVLDRHDRGWVRFEVEPQTDGEDPICTDELIAECQATMVEAGCSSGVAVGSGTINDTVKMTAHQLDRPMAVVGTAPSMNGYTSGIAAILSDGVKTTNPCTAPRAVVADLDVMAEAPARMLASGLGDLLSKPVSNSDWAISARLNGTPHSDEAMEIIEEGSERLGGVAERLQQRDVEAVRGLVESLMLSGIAMSVAGSSSPASGGEHLVSHYIDMTAHARDRPHDLHGCQVGVGTLVSAHLYERLRSFDPSTLDIEARVDALEPWSSYEETLRDRFDVLYEAVVGYAEPAYPTPDRLRQRLQTVVDEWDALLDDADRTLRSRSSIEAELRAADCPVRFRDLGVGRDRARRAILHAKDIRNRYTILHLCWELGRLEEWGEDALDLLYE
ncbi:MAG: sn-glycerol-1-phosphate dehydrogenase, partial [Bradymonadaceae bacterium]